MSKQTTRARTLPVQLVLAFTDRNLNFVALNGVGYGLNPCPLPPPPPSQGNALCRGSLVYKFGPDTSFLREVLRRLGEAVSLRGTVQC